MKKVTAIILLTALLGTPMLFSGMNTVSAKQTISAKITGYDLKTINGNVVYFAGDSDRTLSAVDYSWGSSYLLMFDKDGKLYEAGKAILPSTNDYYGAQTKVTIPAGGFLVAFNSGTLMTAFNACFDGVMLYNATCSMIYDMTAVVDTEKNTITVNIGDKPKVTNETVRFLFVGNSSTYFNGNPIKFEGLCRAAGLDVSVEYCTFGSAYLSEFANETHERGIALRNKLKNNSYDYVVLQDAAGASHESGNAAIQKILPLIEENGAVALLYMRYSTSIAGAAKHYNNYSKLSEEFGIKTCTTAIAFAYSMEDHPEINLIAEDNGHHSKEGSYLAACTWLYCYMGVDPRGNTYTAGLDPDVAAALQEEAYRSATEEYVVPGSASAKVIDGVKYSNIAKSKSYVPSGDIYVSDSWSDTKSDGTVIGKFTDGIFSDYGNDSTNGCYKGTNQTITVDLGEISDIKCIETDIHGNSGWGIPDPSKAEITVSVSDDGVDFTSVGKMSMGDESKNGSWTKRMFTLKPESAETGRYVRLSYTIGGTFLWTSEIAVYGQTHEDSPEESKEESKEESEAVSEEVSVEASAEQSENSVGEASNAEKSDESKSEAKKSSVIVPIIIAAAALLVVLAIAGVVVIKKKKK